MHFVFKNISLTKHLMNESKNTAPSIIARETLLKLGALKLQPTPDNYHKIYDEIAGIPAHQMSITTTKMLTMFVQEFPRHTEELTRFAGMMEQAVRNKNWFEYKAVLMKLIGATADLDQAHNHSSKKIQDDEISWAETIATLLKKLEANHGQMTVAKKRKGLERVLANSSQNALVLQKKINALVESWDVLATDSDDSIEVGNPDDASQPVNIAGISVEDAESDVVQPEQDKTATHSLVSQLQGLLVQILEHVALSQPGDSLLCNDAKSLALTLSKVQSKQEMEQFVADFKQFLEKFEYCCEDNSRLQQGLLKLLNKLLESTSKLLAEDEWMEHHFSKLRETVSQQLDKRVIAEAEDYLEKIVQRQDIINHRLGDAKNTLKKLFACLVENIDSFSGEAGEYHNKIEGYSERISQADDLEVLNQLLVEIMEDTQQMQESTKNYRDGFLAARTEIDVSQEKIAQLESELQQMSKKVHEDHLTGILNRRGLDLAFDREVVHAQRHMQPICYALLDIDNFKTLNDAHGHKVGDEALVYLVNAVKDVTRGDDVVARYGGEEFVILLPNTCLKEAVMVLSRIKRNLTRKFFLHENKKLLITFSAGVAEYRAGELQEKIFKRADEALYRAKKNGKNLILEAV